MMKQYWWFAGLVVVIVTLTVFLLSFQYLKEQRIHQFGAFAHLVPNPYLDPAINAVPYTLVGTLIAALLMALLGLILQARHTLGAIIHVTWEFIHCHRIAFAFIAIIGVSAVLFRYHAVNTPRGIYILDRWTGNIEQVRR